MNGTGRPRRCGLRGADETEISYRTFGGTARAAAKNAGIAAPSKRLGHALNDRKVLEGIVFVLRTGIPWAMLPRELGCGCGMTCWRRLRDWQAAGVFGRLHRALLDRLGRANAIDWSRCSLDSASFPAKGGASSSARTRPTAAGRAASATSWATPAASRSP